MCFCASWMRYFSLRFWELHKPRQVLEDLVWESRALKITQIFFQHAGTGHWTTGSKPVACHQFWNEVWAGRHYPQAWQKLLGLRNQQIGGSLLVQKKKMRCFKIETVNYFLQISFSPWGRYKLQLFLTLYCHLSNWHVFWHIFERFFHYAVFTNIWCIGTAK